MMRLLGWLQGRILIFLLLAAGFSLSWLVKTYYSELQQIWDEEALGLEATEAGIGSYFNDQQTRLNQTVEVAKKKSSAEIDRMIKELETEKEKVEAEKREAEEWPGKYRLSNMSVAAQAHIRIKAIDLEMEGLRDVSEPRKTFEEILAKGVSVFQTPSIKQIENARIECRRSKQKFDSFKRSFSWVPRGRDLIFGRERSILFQNQDKNCKRLNKLVAERVSKIARNTKIRKDADVARKAALASYQKKLDKLKAKQLPENLKKLDRQFDPLKILMEALWWLTIITLTPFAYRFVAYYILAPIAARAAPLRFADAGSAPPQPTGGPSAVSVAITLGPREEALVRQDYLQSSSLTGAKRLRWLLDWTNPLTSLASGMRFLTAISGDGERVTVSAVKDPFAELAVLTVPAGAACVLRPSALAAVVQQQGAPVMIRSQWRFALPAWLTWQWRYMVFHGPVRLVVKGGRGVRIEPAARGRIVGEGQMLGFSTDLAYAVIRSETFPPYFFGREALLKDKVEAGSGVLLIEEAPLSAGRSGLQRGLQGIGDALLKVAGV